MENMLTDSTSTVDIL